jgi:hypothetical protein
VVFLSREEEDGQRNKGEDGSGLSKSGENAQPGFRGISRANGEMFQRGKGGQGYDSPIFLRADQFCHFKESVE